MNKRIALAADRPRSRPCPQLDETELFRLARQGDRGAREQLVSLHLPLARKLASRYAGPHESFDDLTQVASVGLLKAVDGFDPARGTSFRSYAIPTILGELKRHFRDTGWSVHVPRRAQELALRVERGSSQLATLIGRSPSIEEIATHLNLTVEDTLAGLDAAAAHHSSSLDVPVHGSDEDSEPLAEAIGQVDEHYDLVDASVSLAAAVRRLPWSERQVLTLRVVEDLKQNQIAGRLGCSQMQVSRLLRRATTKLKETAALETGP
jgi:RNA polymerase sigma-B factor